MEKSRIYFRDFRESRRGFLNGARRKREDCYDSPENIRLLARRYVYIYIGRNPAKSTGIKRRGALKERETRRPIYSAAFPIRPRGNYLLRETAADFGLRGLQYDFTCKQDIPFSGKTQRV